MVHRDMTVWVVAASFVALAAACSSDNSPSPAPNAVAEPNDTQGAPGPGGSGGSGGSGSSGGSGGSGSSGGSGGSGSGDTRTIRVRCERRGTERSKISVDGNNLAAGTYRARVVSGANTATSGPQAAVGDEVEFDFDSNANDIAAGATRISPTFIEGARVTGEIRDAAGAVVQAATVECEVR